MEVYIIVITFLLATRSGVQRESQGERKAAAWDEGKELESRVKLCGMTE